MLEVTPLPTPRHTFQGGLTISKDGWGELDLSARLQSGMGVTPLVDGDVNADGLANDRAYIPRIDELSGREAEDWHALLAAAPSWARQCLERSQGRIVAPNACRGPWVFQVGLLSIRPDPYRIGLGDRGALTLHLDNIANAVDRIAHRGRSHGWGTLGIPDPVLLRIREFDPTDSHFMYTTNAQFGTDNSRFLSDQGFRAILELRVELGPNPENAAVRQLLRTFAVDIDAHDTDNVKRRLLALAGPTPWSLLRAGARYLPWLQLTTAQREALSELGQRQAARRDSIYSALADLFASGNRQLNSREVRAQWHTAMTASLALNHEFIRSARELLSPEQLAHAEQRGLLPMPFSPEELRRRARAPFILPQ